MDNARAAFEWAVRNAPAQAIALAVERASPVTFTPWRSEVLRWLLAVEPHVGQVDTATRARWSRHCARQLLFAGSSRTFAVAQRAVEESRASGDEQEQFWSIIVLARSWPSERIAEPALQAQIDTLQALVERHPEWDLNAHSVARGTLALLCGKRGDWVAALAHREAELELAHRSGHDGNIGVAQTNLAFALHQLGRNEEAAVRLREFIAAHRGEDSSNVLYAHCMLVRAMLALGHIDDALEHARPALEMCRRYRLAEIEELAALLALRDARPRAAAMLFGYALRVQEELHVRAADSDRGECATLEPRLREALGDPLYERLVVEGRQMADGQADRLLFTRTDAGAEPGGL
jgi:tetratricopeptide (TPR) repeat protein